MSGHDSRRWVAAGLAVSAAAHLCFALWVAWPRQAAGALADNDRPPHDRRQLIEQVKLGDPDSDAMSVAWLGFDEYKRHAARKSEVEQPELRRQRTSPAMTPRAMARAAARAAREAQQRAAETVREARDEAERALAILAAQAVAAAERLPEAGRNPSGLARTGEGAPESSQETAPEQVAEAAAGTPSPAQEAQPASASGPEATDAMVADRESDAASRVDLESKELGKPLAARGLRVKTVRPRFSHYTTVRANPRDPIIRLHFTSNGDVRLVEFVERSGNPDVDRPVEDAAYRWTAEGKALENLREVDPDGSIAIEVRILF